MCVVDSLIHNIYNHIYIYISKCVCIFTSSGCIPEAVLLAQERIAEASQLYKDMSLNYEKRYPRIHINYTTGVHPEFHLVFHTCFGLCWISVLVGRISVYYTNSRLFMIVMIASITWEWMRISIQSHWTLSLHLLLDLYFSLAISLSISVPFLYLSIHSHYPLSSPLDLCLSIYLSHSLSVSFMKKYPFPPNLK